MRPLLAALQWGSGPYVRLKMGAAIVRLAKFQPAVRRSSVGHFLQSCWTKELSIGKLQNQYSEQFGSGVGYC